MGLWLVVGAACLNATASILLKLGVSQGVDFSLADGVVALIVRNGAVVFGLFLFALNVLVYVAALRLLPLSTAYPLMTALSFIIVGTVSVLILGEELTFLKGLGYAVIMLGILLVVGFQFA